MTIKNYAAQNSGTESASNVGITVEYPQISNPLLLLFCGYVIIWYLQIGYRIPMLGAIRFEFIYAATLIFLAMFFTPRIHYDCPLYPFIIMYFLIILIQVPLSYDFDTSWTIFVDRIIKFAFMSFFIVSFVRSPTHLKFFLGAFLLACLKMGQEGLFGRISGGLIWENEGVMRLHGATPLYTHPNSFSGMAMGTLPFVYYLWPSTNKYLRPVLLLIGLLSLQIIMYTGSRTGYVGLCVLIAYIFINSKAKRKFITWFIIFSLLVLPFIPSDYIGRFDTIFTGTDKVGHSTEKRIQILEDAWQIFVDNPFGIGVAAFPKKRIDTFGRWQDTHNLYLEIATNLGIQGLIVVGLFIYNMLKILRSTRISASNLIMELEAYPDQISRVLLDDLRLIEAVALATSAFIIARLALGLFGMDLYEIYWWFALGIATSLYGMLQNIDNTMRLHKLAQTQDKL
ncbi:MAG: O-antigen ligase family protein [Dissulfurispiraceae bacterium]